MQSHFKQDKTTFVFEGFLSWVDSLGNGMMFGCRYLCFGLWLSRSEDLL